MAKEAKWFMFSPENGGVVRTNIVETVDVLGVPRQLTAEDVDRPLSSYSQDIQDLILDTFNTLAVEEAATMAEVVPP